ncbi:putative bifunctional tRNA threonylcarbamoyladenosine biosynthesis protein [uncultured archaeon]|nr:putative bifunctional tRNA threonylcarbamoyladenosine biosynthesis protein [uncultured archaeon]
MDGMKGAEAVLSRCLVLNLPSVEKLRVKKDYRNATLDEKIRGERTRREARLLARAKEAGVLCPVVYQVGGFSIKMKFLEGKMLHHELAARVISEKENLDAAKILVALHAVDVVHGDFTPANLMLTKDGMAVIDFGLGAISNDVEDKATDIAMMKKALGKFGDEFVQAYAKKGGEPGVVRMVNEIESRARYMERG